MKATLRIAAAVIAMLLVIGALTACGDKKSDSKSSDSSSSSPKSSKADLSDMDPAGEVQTRGNITVLVPNDLVLKGGVAGSDLETDPDFGKLTADEHDASCYLITVDDSESALRKELDMFRKSVSDAEDLSFELGGVSWDGFKVMEKGIRPRFNAIGCVDGRYVFVQATGFAADAPVTTAILESLRISSDAGPVEK